MVDSITKLHFHCLHVLTHTNDIDSTALTVRAARPKPNVLLRAYVASCNMNLISTCLKAGLSQSIVSTEQFACKINHVMIA